MSTVSVTGTIITRKHGDASEDVIEIRAGRFDDDAGNYVRLSSPLSGEDFCFGDGSWPLIRDEIDKLFVQMESEQ